MRSELLWRKQMRRRFAACSAAILLSACSNSGSALTGNLGNNIVAESLSAGDSVTDNSLATVTAPGPAPARPQHRYDFKDGDFYGYLGAISEDDQKRGVATPSVVRFRYTGFWNGAHHLQLISDSGSVLENEECAVPCVVIKETDSSGQLRRIGYSSESIIGGAFEDALNGRLKRSPAPGTVSAGYRFRGGDPGDAANWNPVSPPVTSAPAERNEGTENPMAENSF
jgi:hypothetical protein